MLVFIASSHVTKIEVPKTGPLFAALSMLAVARAAVLMIGEVRRQFKELKLLSDSAHNKPDYEKCVEISTRASIIEMVIPSTLAI